MEPVLALSGLFVFVGVYGAAAGVLGLIHPKLAKKGLGIGFPEKSMYASLACSSLLGWLAAAGLMWTFVPPSPLWIALGALLPAGIVAALWGGVGIRPERAFRLLVDVRKLRQFKFKKRKIFRFWRREKTEDEKLMETIGMAGTMAVACTAICGVLLYQLGLVTNWGAGAVLSWIVATLVLCVVFAIPAVRGFE